MQKAHIVNRILKWFLLFSTLLIPDTLKLWYIMPWLCSMEESFLFCFCFWFCFCGEDYAIKVANQLVLSEPKQDVYGRSWETECFLRLSQNEGVELIFIAGWKTEQGKCQHRDQCLDVEGMLPLTANMGAGTTILQHGTHIQPTTCRSLQVHGALKPGVYNARAQLGWPHDFLPLWGPGDLPEPSRLLFQRTVLFKC